MRSCGCVRVVPDVIRNDKTACVHHHQGRHPSVITETRYNQENKANRECSFVKCDDQLISFRSWQKENYISSCGAENMIIDDIICPTCEVRD